MDTLIYLVENDNYIGYHIVVGKYKTESFKGVKATLDGYSRDQNRGYIEVDHYLDGTSIGGSLKSALELILDSFKGHKTTVVWDNVFVRKVVTQWMPRWTTRACKNNNEELSDSELWLNIKNNNINIIPTLGSDQGSFLANVFSKIKYAWQDKSIAKTYLKDIDTLPEIVNQKYLLVSPSDNYKDHLTCSLKLSTSTDLPDLGRDNTHTVYSYIVLDKPIELLDNIISYIQDSSDKDNVLAIILKTLYSKSYIALIKQFGTKIITKPVDYEQVWFIGDTEVAREVSPPNMIAYALANIDKLKAALDDKVDKYITDLNDYIVIDGKVNDKLIKDGKLLVKTSIGHKLYIILNYDLPAQASMYRLVKQKHRFVLIIFKYNQRLQSAIVIKGSSGIGVYSTLTRHIPPYKIIATK